MSHYRALQAETVKFRGHNGDQGEAYYARPIAAGKYPGIVVIHHLPGWDEWIMEVVRKLAHHGYAAISPHFYFREGSESPDDLGARVRAAGGVADAQVVGDVAGAMAYLRAAQCYGKNRNDRLLLRRSPLLSGGVHALWHRRRGRLLGRQCHCRQSEGSQRQAAGRADRPDRK